MKIQILLLSMLAVLTSCGKSNEIRINLGPAKEGKGEIVSKTTDEDFDEIVVEEGVYAEVVKAEHEKVVVSAPSDIIEDIDVEVKAGKLEVGIKSGANISLKNVQVKIFAKEFTHVEANSSAIIEIIDQFTQDKVQVDVNSGGEVKGNLEANTMGITAGSSGAFRGKIWAVDLNMDVSSGGLVSTNGKAKTGTIEVSSGGSISGSGLVVKNIRGVASSGGSMSVTASESISTDASSGGSIQIKKEGNVNIVSQEMSSGGNIAIE